MRVFKFLSALGLSAFMMTSIAGAGEIKADKAWSRETTPTAKTGGVFLRLTNHDEQLDKLISVEGDIAARIEIHTHIQEGEVMKMREIDGVELPAGETVMLQPGGFHIMLINLNEPLTEGEHFPLTLHFEHAEPVEINVPIMDIRHQGDGHGHGMKHHKP